MKSLERKIIPHFSHEIKSLICELNGFYSGESMLNLSKWTKYLRAKTRFNVEIDIDRENFIFTSEAF